MSYFIIYLILMLDGFVKLVTAIAIASLIVSTILIILYGIMAVEGEGVYTKLLSLSKKSVIIALVFGFISVLAPTTKQASVIVGGGAMYEAATSDTAKELSGDIKDIINMKIEEYKRDLSK